MNKKNVWLIGILFFLSACKDTPKDTQVLSLPALTENGINVVVEIPAGTNHKVEYQKDKGTFENDIENGKERIIRFLPYPGNYGFIPSTDMSKALGGDGDALDVLVIGESQATGTVLEAKPIGILELKDGGELDSKIIAIPLDSTLQTFPAQNFQQLLIEYDAAKHIIETWFLNYKGFGKMELIGWKDEKAALQTIRDWASSNN